MNCTCGNRAVPGSDKCWQCWRDRSSEQRRINVAVRQGKESRVPEAFVRAFAKKVPEVRTLDVTCLPSPTSIWLQEIANIQFKLEHDELSADKRRRLEEQLRILRRKLDSN